MSYRNVHVLLVESSVSTTELESNLGAEGLQVTRVSSLEKALEAIRQEPIDVTVFSHPLPASDLIAGCAALRGEPESPPLILLDATDQGLELPRLIPQEMQPTVVLPRPVDACKLASEIAVLLDRPPPEKRRPEDAPLALAAAFMKLRRKSATGILDVRGEGQPTWIRFVNGRVVMAEGGSIKQSLGRVLLRRGELSETDYVRVIDRMTEYVYEHEPVRMGEVLVELGLLTPEEVFEALREQITEKVVVSFRTYLSHSFREEDPETEVGGFGVPAPEALISVALRDSLTAEAATQTLRGALDGPPRLEAQAAQNLPKLALSPDETRALRAVDGSRSLEDWLGQHGETFAPLLCVAWMAGLLTSHIEEPEVPISRPAEAQESATEPQPVKAPDSGRSRLQAERAFRHGQEQLAADRVADARLAFSRAVELEPLEAEYRMFEAWAGYLASRIEAKVQRAKLIACARKVNQEDASSVASHWILGRIAMEENDRELARKEFEAALFRDPNNEQAQKGLEAIDGVTAKTDA